jgi:hypothetical protein
LRCYRCGAYLLDHVVHLEDTADGLYAVVDSPVADHVLACRCGLDIAVTSTRRTVHHPGQIRLIEGAA